MGKIYCHSCSKKCVGDVLKVGEKYFHQICFNCKDCGKTLDAGGFYFRNDNYYCPSDYTNRFSNKCFICGNVISSEVVSALNHHFHRDCFKCNHCNNVFAPGNRVTMKKDRFLCSSCLNEVEKSPSTKVDSGSTPNGLFSKSINNFPNKDVMSDDTITDQGYISADPTSVSSPTQVEEELKTQSFKEPVLRNSKLQSSTSRSLFDFGKFYKSSYLDIQERQEKKRQSLLEKQSTRSLAKSLFSANNQHPIPSKRLVKSHYNDIGSVLCGNKYYTNSNLIPMTSVSEAELNEKENIIRLSSYPAGEKHPDDIPYPIERDDWPAPLSSAILLQEKKQRKQNFFGISVQSELDKIPNDNIIDFTQSLDHLAIKSPQHHQKNLLEVINTTPKHNNDHKYNYDVISASRSPSASIEPMIKPRFSNHTDKSRSRDNTYFNDPQRHHGYSLDFISSTSRPFLVGSMPYNMYWKPKNKAPVHPVVKLKPGYTQGRLYDMKINSLLKKSQYGEQSCASNNNNVTDIHNSISNTAYSWTANRTMSDTFDVQLKNSEYDLTFDEAVFDNVDEFTSSDIDMVTGLKSTRSKYSKDRVKEPTLTSGRSSINSKIESLETWSFWSHKPAIKPPIISYADLVSKDQRILKYLDAHKLETYLSSEEFISLFKLNRSEFYRLPEWKQNDLKRRINLF